MRFLADRAPVEVIGIVGTASDATFERFSGRGACAPRQAPAERFSGRGACAPRQAPAGHAARGDARIVQADSDHDGVGDTCDSTTARVVVNEILANEPGNVTAAEFVELVNLGNQSADLSGWTLSDSTAIRHTFAPGTRLAAGRALVVFGGASGIPAGLSNAVAASTGTLALNNTTDSVIVRTSTGATIAQVNYTSDLAAQDGVSMNLSPEGTPGSRYVLHTTLSASPASPGVRSTGAPW